MKKAILILTVCLISTFSKAQIAYYDAEELKGFITPNGMFDGTNEDILKRITTILKMYNEKVTNYAYVKNHLANSESVDYNPFLAPYIPMGGSENLNANNVTSNTLLGSKIGGLDVTNIANALSSIMIEHAKEELTAAFFDRFNKFIEENKEFQILFPKTTSTMSTLLSYRYTEMLPALQASFLEDLNEIVYRIHEVLQLEKYKIMFKNFPEIRLAAESIKVIHELEKGDATPADVITEFAALEFWDDEAIVNEVSYKNIKNSLELADILSKSIIDTTDVNKVWVDFKNIKIMINDPTLFKIYLGLLYEQIKTKTITFYKSTDDFDELATLMQKNSDDLNYFSKKFSEFFDLADKVDTTYEELNEKRDDHEKITQEDIYNYINLSIDIAEYSCGIASKFEPSFEPDKYLSAARSANDIYKSVYKKEYGLAVTDLFKLFKEFNVKATPQEYKNYETDLEKYTKNLEGFKEDDNYVALFKSVYAISPYKIDSKNSIDLFNNSEYKDKTKLNSKREEIILEYANAIWGKENIPDFKTIDSTLQSIKEKLVGDLNDSGKMKIKNSFLLEMQLEISPKISDFIEKARPYALFIANVANAETEADVKAALEAVILPVGSSRIKKYSYFNFNVQSYLGAGYSSGKDSFKSSWNQEFWVSAPVGLSVTKGFGKGGYAGFFFPLIDLGAIVDYKLKAESTDPDADNSDVGTVEDYKIELGQIFSPGAYLVYGFPLNIPLTLGVGTQYGPGLTSIKVEGTTEVIDPYWRFNAFLAVDIPLFNFMNKPRTDKQ